MKDFYGFVPINRKLFEHEFWREKREFSKFEAWVDIVQTARYEDDLKTDFIAGKAITYGRGQLPGSVRFLKERWNWKSITKVGNYLEYLQKKDMISIEKGQGQNVITVCKYDTYNPKKEDQRTAKGQQKDTERTAKGQQKDESNKDNKGIKGKGNKETKQSLHQSAIDAFCQDYKARFNTAYVFTGGKDGTAIKQLLAKVKTKTEEAGLEPTDENILQGLTLYIQSITDDWVLRNYTPAVINSKFNELFKAAKNGTSTSKSDHSDYLRFKLAREQAGNSIYSETR